MLAQENIINVTEKRNITNEDCLCFNIKSLQGEPSDAFVQKLRAPKNTITESHDIEQYCGNDVNFRKTFNQFLSNPNEYLALFTSCMGSGKTSFIMEWLTKSVNYLQQRPVALMILPKKTNIDQLKAKYKKAVIAYTADEKKANEEFKKANPIIASLPSSFLISKESANVVLTVPELAKEAYNALLRFKGRVDYIIVDEAHDVFANLPSYRNIEKFFDVIEDALNEGRSTKVILSTATAEPLNWIRFDRVFDVHTKRPIQSGNLVEIPVARIGSHQSFSTLYAKSLMSLSASAGRPLFVYYDNKEKINQMMDYLEGQGFHCLSITADNINDEDNVVRKSIIEEQELPSFDYTAGMTGRPVNFIFATSTIISGISIKKNPLLGDAQYIPVIIINDRNSMNTTNIEQFACRLRYDVPQTTILFKAAGNVYQDDLGYHLAEVKNSKIHLTNEQIINIMFRRRWNAKSEKPYNLVDDYGKIVTKKPMDENIVKSMSDFSIFLHARREYDARLYGEHRIGKLYEELSKHLFCTGVYCYPMIYAREDDIANKITKERKQEERKQLVKVAETMTKQKISVTELFSEKPSEEMKECRKAFQKKLSVLHAAIETGHTDLADNYIRSVYAAGGITSVPNREQFLIEKKVLLTPVSDEKINLPDGTTYSQPTYLEILLSGKENQYPQKAQLLKEIKHMDAYKEMEKVHKSNLLPSIKSVESYLEGLTATAKRKVLERINTSACLAQTYMMGSDITHTLTGKTFSGGIEIKLFIDTLYDLENHTWKIAEGQIITKAQLEAMAESMTSVMKQFDVPGKYSYKYTVKTITDMFMHILYCGKISDGIQIVKLDVRKMDARLLNPDLIAFLNS